MTPYETALATSAERQGLALLSREEIWRRRLRAADRELLRRAIRKSLHTSLTWEIGQHGTIRHLLVESGRLRVIRFVSEDHARYFFGGWPALREEVIGEAVSAFMAEAVGEESE